MKTKVLMIYPEIPSTYWSLDHAIAFMGSKSVMPPLGLLTVASMLPDSFEVKLVDMNVGPLADGDIESADLIFISAMIVQKNSFAEVVKRCREFGKPIVAGGPYPTSSHEKIEGVDHFVLNEGEITLPLFLADYEKGCARPVYASSEKPDIAKTPAPRLDLIDVNAYTCMAVQYSRGCPFNCEFCDIIEMYGRRPRTKTPEQFLSELDAVYATGFRGSVFVVDDNFIGNKREVKRLLPAIIGWIKEHRYPFSFFTEASINLADDEELMELMVEANFSMVFIGIETPVEKSLVLSNKSQNMKSDLHESILRIQRKGIEVQAGFIVGFDTDPDDVFDRQIDFIQKSGIPTAMIGILTVLPNTQLHRRIEREGRLIAEANGNNCDIEINFKTNIPKNRLIEGYKRVLSEIYDAKNYFYRCIELIRRMPKKIRQRTPFELRHIRAFFLSLAKQIFSPYGHRYIAYLFKTLYFNFRRFPHAINLAIKEYHFYKITEHLLAAHDFSSHLETTLSTLNSMLAQTVREIPEITREVIEKFGRRCILRIRKRYARLNRTVQKYMKDKLHDFEKRYEVLINRWCDNDIVKQEFS